jgi:hypothetical protein
MKTYNTTEIWDVLETLPFSHICLKSETGKTLVPFPSKTKTKETRITEIKNYLSSDHIEDGYYTILTRNGASKNSETSYTILKGSSLADHLPQERIIYRQEKTELMTDSDILDMRVENERLKMELEQCQDKIIELENSLTESLNDQDLNESAPSTFGWLKDVIPALADSYFQIKRDQLEVDQAKLGLEYEKTRNKSPEAPPQKTPEINDLTLEEIEQAKHHSPKDFYAWLADPINAEYYDNLNNSQND